MTKGKWMGFLIDSIISRDIHAQWLMGGRVTEAMKQTLIEIARKNGWPVPAQAVANARKEGFNTSGLLLK